MSLYSSLTQVLAPFAAKIKGIQTGYDGTEYTSPGEAVREQINDLHVLIGHVPGRAIEASAVAYNDTNVAAELTNVNGRLTLQAKAIDYVSHSDFENVGFYNSNTYALDSNTLYRYSEPIFVKKWAEVNISAWTDNSTIGVVLQCNTNGTVVRCIKKGEYRAQTDYTFVAESDMYIIVCGRSSYPLYANVFNSVASAMDEIALNSAVIGRTVIEMECGAVNVSGLNNTSTTRIRTTYYHAVAPGTDYIISCANNNVQVSVSFYSINDYVTPRSSYLDWQSMPARITIPANTQYIRFLLKYTNDAEITPDATGTVELITADSLYGNYAYDDIAKRIEYTGEKISVKNTLTYKRSSYKIALPSNFRIQGGTTYGDYLVIGTDKSHAVPDINAPSLYVFNKETGAYIGGVAITGAPDTLHCNTVTFANNLHNGNTVFPYLYVSEWDGNGNIYVVDVNIVNNTLSATIVQIIDITSLSTSLVGAGYSDFAINSVQNIIYLIRYALPNDYTATPGNYTAMTAFTLPVVTQGTVMLQDSDILSHTQSDMIIDYRQQCLFNNGRVLIASGYNAGALIAINPLNGHVTSVVDLTPIISTSEPNAIFIDNGKLNLMVAWSPWIYTLNFGT